MRISWNLWREVLFQIGAKRSWGYPGINDVCGVKRLCPEINKETSVRKWSKTFIFLNQCSFMIYRINLRDMCCVVSSINHVLTFTKTTLFFSTSKARPRATHYWKKSAIVAVLVERTRVVLAGLHVPCSWHFICLLFLRISSHPWSFLILHPFFILRVCDRLCVLVFYSWLSICFMYLFLSLLLRHSSSLLYEYVFVFACWCWLGLSWRWCVVYQIFE